MVGSCSSPYDSDRAIWKYESDCAMAASRDPLCLFTTYGQSRADVARTEKRRNGLMEVTSVRMAFMKEVL